jgi:steroid 5-alpha reductase family enzyme
MEPLSISGQLFTGLVLVAGAMFVLWVVQWFLGNAGIVGVAWPASLGGLTLFYGCTSSLTTARPVLVAGLTCAWAFRLAFYLLNDRVLGKPEDGRYQMMRYRAGDRAQQWFFGVFMLQAVFSVVFSIPILVAVRNEDPFPTRFDLIAIVVWAIALTGESAADAQLARFRADPANKGKTCRTGLWHYTRHPNYFFEWLYWWTYVLLTWNVNTMWLALVFGPALMFVFLLYFTGVPYTEAQALRTRTDYADYQRTTSLFFPWFPVAPHPGPAPVERPG